MMCTILSNPAQEANKTLEKIQKSLEDYLETKRMGFPRSVHLLVYYYYDKIRFVYVKANA